MLSFCFYIFSDIDNNGFLDQNDFECMAIRACVIEGKGECTPNKLGEYQHIMRSLWDEISDLADFDKVNCHKVIKGMINEYILTYTFFFLIKRPIYLNHEHILINRMDKSVQANSRRLSKRLALVKNMKIFLRYNYNHPPTPNILKIKNIFSIKTYLISGHESFYRGQFQSDRFKW